MKTIKTNNASFNHSIWKNNLKYNSLPDQKEQQLSTYFAAKQDVLDKNKVQDKPNVARQLRYLLGYASGGYGSSMKNLANDLRIHDSFFDNAIKVVNSLSNKNTKSQEFSKELDELLKNGNQLNLPIINEGKDESVIDRRNNLINQLNSFAHKLADSLNLICDKNNNGTEVAFGITEKDRLFLSQVVAQIGQAACNTCVKHDSKFNWSIADLDKLSTNLGQIKKLCEEHQLYVRDISNDDNKTNGRILPSASPKKQFGLSSSSVSNITPTSSAKNDSQPTKINRGTIVAQLLSLLQEPQDNRNVLLNKLIDQYTPPSEEQNISEDNNSIAIKILEFINKLEEEKTITTTDKLKIQVAVILGSLSQSTQAAEKSILISYGKKIEECITDFERQEMANLFFASYMIADDTNLAIAKYLPEINYAKITSSLDNVKYYKEIQKIDDISVATSNVNSPLAEIINYWKTLHNNEQSLNIDNLANFKLWNKVQVRAYINIKIASQLGKLEEELIQNLIAGDINHLTVDKLCEGNKELKRRGYLGAVKPLIQKYANLSGLTISDLNYIQQFVIRFSAPNLSIDDLILLYDDITQFKPVHDNVILPDFLDQIKINSKNSLLNITKENYKCLLAFDQKFTGSVDAAVEEKINLHVKNYISDPKVPATAQFKIKEKKLDNQLEPHIVYVALEENMVYFIDKDGSTQQRSLEVIGYPKNKLKDISNIQQYLNCNMDKMIQEHGFFAVENLYNRMEAMRQSGYITSSAPMIRGTSNKIKEIQSEYELAIAKLHDLKQWDSYAIAYYPSVIDKINEDSICKKGDGNYYLNWSGRRIIISNVKLIAKIDSVVRDKKSGDQIMFTAYDIRELATASEVNLGFATESEQLIYGLELLSAYYVACKEFCEEVELRYASYLWLTANISKVTSRSQYELEVAVQLLHISRDVTQSFNKFIAKYTELEKIVQDTDDKYCLKTLKNMTQTVISQVADVIQSQMIKIKNELAQANQLVPEAITTKIDSKTSAELSSKLKNNVENDLAILESVWTNTKGTLLQQAETSVEIQTIDGYSEKLTSRINKIHDNFKKINVLVRAVDASNNAGSFSPDTENNNAGSFSSNTETAIKSMLQEVLKKINEKYSSVQTITQREFKSALKKLQFDKVKSEIYQIVTDQRSTPAVVRRHKSSSDLPNSRNSTSPDCGISQISEQPLRAHSAGEIPRADDGDLQLVGKLDYNLHTKDKTRGQNQLPLDALFMLRTLISNYEILKPEGFAAKIDLPKVTRILDLLTDLATLGYCAFTKLVEDADKKKVYTGGCTRYLMSCSAHKDLEIKLQNHDEKPQIQLSEREKGIIFGQENSKSIVNVGSIEDPKYLLVLKMPNNYAITYKIADNKLDNIKELVNNNGDNQLDNIKELANNNGKVKSIMIALTDTLKNPFKIDSKGKLHQPITEEQLHTLFPHYNPSRADEKFYKVINEHNETHYRRITVYLLLATSGVAWLINTLAKPDGECNELIDKLYAQIMQNPEYIQLIQEQAKLIIGLDVTKEAKPNSGKLDSRISRDLDLIQENKLWKMLVNLDSVFRTDDMLRSNLGETVPAPAKFNLNKFMRNVVENNFESTSVDKGMWGKLKGFVRSIGKHDETYATFRVYAEYKQLAENVFTQLFAHYMPDTLGD